MLFVILVYRVLSLTPTSVGSYHSPKQSHNNKMPQAVFNPPVAEGNDLLNEKVFTL